MVLGGTLGVFAHRWIPAQYQSETLIMVIPQRIPDTYVKSTVTASVEDRLRSVSEQILSRSRLERIIRDLGLYKERLEAGAMEDVVQGMRSDIELKLEGKESSFRLTYSNPDAKVAQRVTERLAALYIEENLRDREQLAESASTFLESQLQDAKQRLIQQERKLELYRRRYAGQLPSQLQGNLQSLQSAQMQYQSLQESINRARERRLLVERQIADAQSLPVDIGSGVGTGTAQSSPPSAAAQLEAALARRDALTLQYTASHPDVLALEETIRDLQVKAEKEMETRAPQAVPDKALSPTELARQKRLRALQGELEVIDHQLSASQSEESRLKAAMADYNAKIDVVPTRESELVELTRDYSTLQETYSSLLAKREDSKLAANLERRQIGEQFKILDPASLPERAHNQKQRLAVLFGGPVGGILLGLLLVGFLEYLDSSFRSEDDVARVLSIPVLALIPVMESDDDEGQGRGRRRPAPTGSSLGLRMAASFAGRAYSRSKS